MLADSQILRQNPWWTRDSWRDDDPHLRRLGDRAIRLPSPEVEEIDLEAPAVHILRGPRQVGKSTDLKLLVERALSSGFGRRQVAYLSLDLLEGQPAQALAETIERALVLAGSEPPRLVLLDEVTATASWRTTLKAMWDAGVIDRDVVVCTGSSAIDLAHGAAERLPGRRGAGRDYLVLPQSFGAFASTIHPEIPAPPGMTVGAMLAGDGRRELERMLVHLPTLQAALDRYLLFGGLPAAVAEAAGGLDEPSEEVKRVLWDSFVKEVQRKGASIPAAQALLERVMRSLGSRVSWSRLAKEMDVPLGRGRARAGATEPRTLQGYVEFMAANYFALVLYFWRSDSGSGDLSKDKKVYFGDPLLHTITADRLGLERDPHADVENALALALYRRYEPRERRAENLATPERLHVWGTSKGGEIDFVCGSREEMEALEVADRGRLDRRKATAASRAFPGRPAIVASRDELELGESFNLVPASIALWALS